MGERREDGLHELRSLFCPLLLGDRIEVSDAPGEADEVVCPGVEGPNLAAVALEALRARGWRRAPVRVEIDKRIPIAAGLGGGSADAAAVLRLAAGEVPDLRRGRRRARRRRAVAARAPVRARRRRRRADRAARAAGGVRRRADPRRRRSGDRRRLRRGRPARSARRGRARAEGELLRDAAAGGASPLDYAELLVNDLEQAAISLRPRIAEALAALEEVGAARAFVTGSGPTAFGLFADLVAADAAASALPPRYANAIVTAPQRRR